MKLKLRELRDGRHTLPVNEPAKPHELPDCGPLTGMLQIEKSGPVVVITGEIHFAANLHCSRCLKSYSRQCAQDIELCYQPRALAGDRDDHETELTSDDLVTIDYRGNEIDLWPELREAALLALPLKPLCRDDCRGLCPRCGRDLNAGDCGCRDDRPDPRWDKLRKLSGK